MFLDNVLKLEQEKLYYFIIVLPQRIVLVKTGEKADEKEFLGYEFSEREKKEGIHPIKKGKNIDGSEISIDDCTKLFDSEVYNNPQKASTYIYEAFKGNYNLAIHPSLNENVEYFDLINLIDFANADFDKKIIKTSKSSVNYDAIWETKRLQTLVSVATIQKGKSITKAKTIKGDIPVIAGGQSPAYYHNKSNRAGNIITVSASGAYAGFLNYFDVPIFASDCNTITSLNEETIPTKLLYYILKVIQAQFYELQRGQAQPHVYGNDIERVKIPVFDKPKELFNALEALEEKSKSIVIHDIETQRKIIIQKFL